MADQQTIEQRAAERAARKQKNAKARRSYRAKQKAKRAERGPSAHLRIEHFSVRPTSVPSA